VNRQGERQQQIPFGDDNKNGKNNINRRSTSDENKKGDSN
jgi:hypothetical protein